VTPLDFVYERIGKFIKPDANKAAWLSGMGQSVRDPSKKPNRLGLGGCAILVTKDRCTMVSNFKPFFVGDAGHIEFRSCDEAGGVNRFLNDCRFDPPCSGKFSILDLSGKRIISERNVSLNLNHDIVRISTIDGIVITNNKAIRYACEQLEDGFDLSDKKTISMFKRHARLIDGYRKEGLSEAEKVIFDKEVYGSPFARVYDRLVNADSENNFYQYLDWRNQRRGRNE